MALHSFCGLLTLQVGATVLSAVFFAIAGAILSANIFGYTSDYGWVAYLLMIIFVILMLIAGALMFASAYSESRSLALAALVLIVIMLAYWIALCAFSFLSSPSQVDGVCIDTRCPESFWIANLRYRRRHLERYKDYLDYPDYGKTPPPGARRRRMVHTLQVFYGNISAIENHPMKIKESEFLKQMSKSRPSERTQLSDDTKNARRRQKTTHVKEHVENKGGVFEVMEETQYVSHPNGLNKFANERSDNLQWRTTTFGPYDEVVTESEPSKYIMGVPLVGAIILFIINLLFLLFSAYVMYSWAQELSYADYYYDVEEEPVVVVEEY